MVSLDGTPAGAGDVVKIINDIKLQALLDVNIIPILRQTVGADYQGLVDTFGFGTVVPLSSNSSDLVNAYFSQKYLKLPIEVVNSGSGNDSITGNSLDNRLQAAGNDTGGNDI